MLKSHVGNKKASTRGCDRRTLGGTPEPKREKVKVLKALQIYFDDIAFDEISKKSAKQVKNWKNVKLTLINYFISGIRSSERKRSQLTLTLSEREDISRSLSIGASLRSIAKRLRRAPSTISREIAHNGDQVLYRASTSDKAAWDRARRLQLCKLASNKSLRDTVSRQLQKKWAPQQIAG